MYYSYYGLLMSSNIRKGIMHSSPGPGCAWSKNTSLPYNKTHQANMSAHKASIVRQRLASDRRSEVKIQVGQSAPRVLKGFCPGPVLDIVPPRYKVTATGRTTWSKAICTNRKSKKANKQIKRKFGKAKNKKQNVSQNTLCRNEIEEGYPLGLRIFLESAHWVYSSDSRDTLKLQKKIWNIGNYNKYNIIKFGLKRFSVKQNGYGCPSMATYFGSCKSGTHEQLGPPLGRDYLQDRSLLRQYSAENNSNINSRKVIAQQGQAHQGMNNCFIRSLDGKVTDTLFGRITWLFSTPMNKRYG